MSASNHSLIMNIGVHFSKAERAPRAAGTSPAPDLLQALDTNFCIPFLILLSKLKTILNIRLRLFLHLCRSSWYENTPHAVCQISHTGVPRKNLSVPAKDWPEGFHFGTRHNKPLPTTR